MLQISTSGICPKCGGSTLWYEDGKFVCAACDRKYISKDIKAKAGDYFEVTTRITKQEFIDKSKQLEDLANRFSAVFLGCDVRKDKLYIGWDNEYPVRLNMLVQELNEILD